MQPHDRCCCSLRAHRRGCCHGCCGPPIWHAGRGIGTGLSAMNLVTAMFSLVSLEMGEECSRVMAESVSFLSIVVRLVGTGVYAFGIYASYSQQAEMAMAYLMMHIGYQSVDVPLSICTLGLFSKTPRVRDPEIDRRCCALELHGRGTFGGVCGRAVPSGADSARGWVWGVFLALMNAYFAFVIWSMWRKCKDRDASRQEGAVMIALPSTAVLASPPAYAVPLSTEPASTHAPRAPRTVQGVLVETWEGPRAGGEGEAASTAPGAAPPAPTAPTAPTGTARAAEGPPVDGSLQGPVNV